MSSYEEVFAYIDFYDHFSKTQIVRFFQNPIDIVSIANPLESKVAFNRVEKYVSEGCTAVGYLSYDCSRCFDDSYSIFDPLVNNGIASGVANEAFNDNLSGAVLSFLIFKPSSEATKPLQTFRRTADYYCSQLETGISKKEYYKNFEKIREEIINGNVYQVNYTFPVQFYFWGDVVSWYEALKKKQGSKYNALIFDGSNTIVSLSPELFFQKNKEKIIVKPMKGTSARGSTNVNDEKLKNELMNSKKNQAENSMIVDLLRNDLGKICKAGTIRTGDLMKIETFPTLHQMTSKVTGDLLSSVSTFDIFKALFPSGSITGAPKINAMNLISQLENTSRGIYTGAVGIIEPGNKSIFNVAIRTLSLSGEKGKMGVGSGLVFDSSADLEYDESLLKYQFVQEESDPFYLIETMKIESGVILRFKKHMERLKNSARYFHITFDMGAMQKEISELLGGKSEIDTTRKFRLILFSSGKWEFEITELLPQPGKERGTSENPCVLGLSKIPVSSRNVFLQHKTSVRTTFNEEYSKAVSGKYDDVIFLNEKGEVTQGCIHNIFAKIDGKWYTPPPGSGLLPGIMRASLLDTLQNCQEEELTMKEIIKADELLICNSLKGLRKATFTPMKNSEDS